MMFTATGTVFLRGIIQLIEYSPNLDENNLFASLLVHFTVNGVEFFDFAQQHISYMVLPTNISLDLYDFPNFYTLEHLNLDYGHDDCVSPLNFYELLEAVRDSRYTQILIRSGQYAVQRPEVFQSMLYEVRHRAVNSYYDRELMMAFLKHVKDIEVFKNAQLPENFNNTGSLNQNNLSAIILEYTEKLLLDYVSNKPSDFVGIFDNVTEARKNQIIRRTAHIHHYWLTEVCKRNYVEYNPLLTLTENAKLLVEKHNSIEWQYPTSYALLRDSLSCTITKETLIDLFSGFVYLQSVPIS